MAVIKGLRDSFAHPENGMTEADMRACLATADQLNEVIIFRSTGPWAKRWLEAGYPSKNFHVKGKSSDWGPHAGLVPYDGTYSKVGSDGKKAGKGTQENQNGLGSGFAGQVQLVMTAAQLNEALYRPEEALRRTAIFSMQELENGDRILAARRSGDGQAVNFHASRRADGSFAITVYPVVAAAGVAAAQNAERIAGTARGLEGLAKQGLVSNSPFVERQRQRPPGELVPLMVMTSTEAGAGNKPMTGDYDLMAVCPTWADYGSAAPHDIEKPAIILQDDHGLIRHEGQVFIAGVGMDNVMDARLSTAGSRSSDFLARRQKFMHTGGHSSASLNTMFDDSEFGEHGDMGNLTPRILRCVNLLNEKMGAIGARAALRRVHHNAESHRYHLFGAVTQQDMIEKDDAFPLTVFQPAQLLASGRLAADYTAVCTLEKYDDFLTYADALDQSGYRLPRNAVWGMSQTAGDIAQRNSRL
jgi:hypothetical protein